MPFVYGNKLHWLRSLTAEDFGQAYPGHTPFRLPKIKPPVDKVKKQLYKLDSTLGFNTQTDGIPIEDILLASHDRKVPNNKHTKGKSSRNRSKDVNLPKLKCAPGPPEKHRAHRGIGTMSNRSASIPHSNIAPNSCPDCYH